MWLVEDSTDTLLGAFDLGFDYPFDSAGKATTYLPSVKVDKYTAGEVLKISIKWFYYDGTSYQEVSDISKMKFSKYTMLL